MARREQELMLKQICGNCQHFAPLSENPIADHSLSGEFRTLGITPKKAFGYYGRCTQLDLNIRRTFGDWEPRQAREISGVPFGNNPSSCFQAALEPTMQLVNLLTNKPKNS